MNICSLCGDTNNFNHIVSNENNDVKIIINKFQWITRKYVILITNTDDIIEMQRSCENCLQKMCLLIESVAEIWKLFIQTQDLLHNGCSIQKDKTEVGIQESELLLTEDFCDRNETTPFSTPKKELKTESYNIMQNYNEISDAVLRKEIEASISIEGCTNLEWLLDTESSDGKVCASKHLKNTVKEKEPNHKVGITRTNNRGLTYTTDSPNFILKKASGAYECTVCHKSFHHSYRAEHHVRSIHTNEKPFSCQVCRKGFVGASNLNRHISCVHEKGKFICAKCGRRFQKRYLLSAHEQSHNGPPTIACPYGKCTKSFYADFVLKMHINNTHSGLKFVCEQCGKAFRTKIRLTNHILRHGDKNIQCPHCPKMFYIKTDRLLHMKYHKDDLPWRCGNCAMYFKTTRGLQNHLSVAHGEKVSKVDLYKRNTAK